MLMKRAYPVGRAAGCRRAVLLRQVPLSQMGDSVKIGRLATCQLSIVPPCGSSKVLGTSALSGTSVKLFQSVDEIVCCCTPCSFSSVGGVGRADDMGSCRG